MTVPSHRRTSSHIPILDIAIARRRLHGLTQADIARRSGFAHTTIAQW